MPRSKKRKPHHDHPIRPLTEKPKKRRSPELVAAIFFGLLGMGIAFFAAGTSILWLIVGALAGAAGGYLFGKQVDKQSSDK